MFDHYVRIVGGKRLFHCNFDLSKLPLKLPDYYGECLTTWTKLNVQPVTQLKEIVNQIFILNNKFICIGKKKKISF